MMLQTSANIPIEGRMLGSYLQTLINLFFKILPLKEGGEASLDKYLLGLQAELLGCQSLIMAIQYDPIFLSLLSILQYLIDHPDCEVCVVKREVFSAISLCNKLKERYAIDDGRCAE